MADQLTLTRAQEERAEALHMESLIIDGLGGGLIHPEPPADQGKPYLDRLMESNIRAANVTLIAHASDMEAALEQMFHYFNLFQVAGDRVVLVKTVDDIERAAKEKKVGIIFGFQSPTPVDTKFYRWTILHQLGLRVCQIAYMEPNIMADGCLEPRNGPLTYYGIQAVNEMNRLGIVVDLSHAGERSSLEAIEKSKKPCIFSHSNAKAITPSARNLTDEQIKLVASKGGTIGLSPHGFMSHKKVGIQPTIFDYLDHFEYVAKLVGTNHIALGSDIFEKGKLGWETTTKLFYNSPWIRETVLNRDYAKVQHVRNLTRGLVVRGFSDEDIKKILGENLMRVFRNVWHNEPVTVKSAAVKPTAIKELAFSI